MERAATTASRRESWAVVDLGFGDAGKGATVDFLVRDRGAGLVVRWNGGAQAGHAVQTADGRRHVFSQLGSGSFVPGVATHLGPAFVLHPGGLLVEVERLAAVGVPRALARLTVDARALVIGPFQQAAGRLRELLRGDAPHGTCGVGVGEAVGDALARPDEALRAGDLDRPGVVAKRLAAQQERKRTEVAADARALADPRVEAELGLLHDDDAVERVVAAWAPLARDLAVLDAPGAAARIAGEAAVVFEGAQGLLLDERFGFHPHTSWSDATPAGADALAAEAGRDRPHRIGVIRSYATRHGAGPFPTHDGRLDAALPEPGEDEPGWQGAFRRGALDLVLLRYALAACGGVDGLAVTHLDRVGESVPLCDAYDVPGEVEPGLVNRGPGGRVISLVPGPTSDLDRQRRLGDLLRRVEPAVEAVARDELVGRIETALGVRVELRSVGPTAGDRCWESAPPVRFP